MSKKSFKNEIKKRETPAEELLLKSKAKSKNKSKKAQKNSETKSARLNLLLKPSTKKSIGKLSTIDRVSSNELINRILNGYIKTRTKDLDRYDKFYREK